MFVAYFLVYFAALMPGWPLGRALAGRQHPARWILGSLIGYGLTAIAIGVSMALGQPKWWAYLLSWAVIWISSVAVARRITAPVIRLPIWRRSTTARLSIVLLVTLFIVSAPYGRVGERDAQGQSRYRAYCSIARPGDS